MTAALLPPPPRVRRPAPAFSPPAVPPPAVPVLTEAEYLRVERTSADDQRHEFDGTRRIPMSGASRRHVKVAKAVERALDDLIGDRPLETHRSDLRLRVPSGRYRYPDVMLTPDPPAMLDGEQDTVLNPRVIVEVLSPTTAATDQGVKLAEYRTIPSLTDYVLLSQDEPAADHYARVGGGAANPDEPDAWRVVTHAGPGAAVPLTGLGPLALAPLYPAG